MAHTGEMINGHNAPFTCHTHSGIFHYTIAVLPHANVQEVYSNSPAAKAGLQAYDDYILGTDSSLQEVRRRALVLI